MLEYPYMELPTRDGVDFKPMIQLRFPSINRSLDVLADTGAQNIVLPVIWANRLGVILTPGAREISGLIAGESKPYFVGEVQLELRKSSRIVQWVANVAFMENPTKSLFGYLGGLEFFHAHFLGPERRLLLDPRPNLPVP